MAHNGDDTGFGFDIPSSWPRWKLQCRATSRTTGNQCRRWSVRGMPTCRFHGSGGIRGKQLGLIRYLCWIIIGQPPDTPTYLAKYAAMAAVLNAMFHEGKGNEAQKLTAAMWLVGAEIPPYEEFKKGPRKSPKLDLRAQEVLDSLKG